MADSAENMKRSNVEAAGEQLREIKRLCREEPKSFKRKENGIQYKFNSKLPEAKSHLEINRSNSEADGKKIRRAEEGLRRLEVDCFQGIS